MQKKSSVKSENPTVWFPEIYYEEDSKGQSSRVPFIAVPQNEEMPKFIFIFESRETGEFEPGPRGEDLPVTEMTLHQYADMDALKQGLAPVEFDRVRAVLGLKPLKEATAGGQKITNNIRTSLSGV